MAGPIWNWSTEIGTRSTFLDKILMRPAGNNFRFIDRDGPFMQSLGKWNIQRSASNSQHLRDIQKLYLRDVYHSFIDGGNIWQHLFVYSVVYALCFLVFAFAYLYISDRCGLGLEGRFIRAYYLSLETMVTIGYGTPDPYYNDCWEGTFVLTFQSLLQYFLNALVIGSVFVRMTRPQARSNTILFSDKAVIQVIDNAFYLMFQVCEAKHHDLLRRIFDATASGMTGKEHRHTRFFHCACSILMTQWGECFFSHYLAGWSIELTIGAPCHRIVITCADEGCPNQVLSHLHQHPHMMAFITMQRTGPWIFNVAFGHILGHNVLNDRSTRNRAIGIPVFALSVGDPFKHQKCFASMFNIKLHKIYRMVCLQSAVINLGKTRISLSLVGGRWTSLQIIDQDCQVSLSV